MRELVRQPAALLLIAVVLSGLLGTPRSRPATADETKKSPLLIRPATGREA